MVTKVEVYEAADELRSECLPVRQKELRERVERNTGRGGSMRDIAPLFLEWKADRDYDPVTEAGGVPKNISALVARAITALWEAAQAEAKLVHQSERVHFKATLSDEQALRTEALTMADEMVERVKDLNARIAQLEAEAVVAQKHLGLVRSNNFWERVVQDMYAVLPENGSMHVDEIAERLGADLVEEAKSYPEEWSRKTLDKKIKRRIHHKRLFFRVGKFQYRRRRLEDNLQGSVGRTGA